MEDLKHIEKLLEKYYNGETSLEEERKLHWFFQTQDVPIHLKPDAEIFRYTYSYSREDASPGLTEKLSHLIDEQSKKQKVLFTGRTVRLISALAASILILISLWIGVNRHVARQQYASRYKDTFDNPQLAYIETKKVLLLVSEKLNSGTKDLQHLQKLNQGVSLLQPILSFGPGIQRLEKISKFNEATELISKKQ